MGSARQIQTGTTITKLLLFCMLVGGLNDSGPKQITKNKDCICWEDFKPEKGSDGTYYCRGNKHHRIFGCNEEKPPLCRCLLNGKIIELDLGELNCLGLNIPNGRWCHNREELQEYFKKHPAHMIYD